MQGINALDTAMKLRVEHRRVITHKGEWVMWKWFGVAAWIALVGAISYHIATREQPAVIAAEPARPDLKLIGPTRHGTLPTIVEPKFEPPVTECIRTGPASDKRPRCREEEPVKKKKHRGS